MFFFLWGHGARDLKNGAIFFVWRQNNKTTIVVLLFGAKKNDAIFEVFVAFTSKKVENDVVNLFFDLNTVIKLDRIIHFF